MMLHEIEIEYAAYTLVVTYSDAGFGPDIERIDLKDPRDIAGLLDCAAASGGNDALWSDIDKRLADAIRLQAYDNARTIEDVA
jgi:hypothetical protein